MQTPITTAAALTATFALASAASAQITTFYSSSFEGTDGGWVAGSDDPTFAGDWERGMPSTFDPSTGSSGTVGGFTNAADGSELWATNLDGPHTNAGAASLLSQTFDFSNLGAPITLSWSEFLRSGSNSFDMATVQVNGMQEYLADGTQGTASGGIATFEDVSVDLSAYAGLSSVEIVYSFDTTTVVNRDGWYVDDVSITGVIPEPATAGLLAVGGLTLLRRRR